MIINHSKVVVSRMLECQLTSFVWPSSQQPPNMNISPLSEHPHMPDMDGGISPAMEAISLYINMCIFIDNTSTQVINNKPNVLV